MNEPSQPAWARSDAFVQKPESSAYGVMALKGEQIGFDSLSALQEHLGSGQGKLAWVWVPEHPNLVAPEEVPDLVEPLKKRRLIFVQEDREEVRKTLPFTALIVVFAAYSYFTGARPFGFAAFEVLILALFAFLYFTARPWWDAFKGQGEARKMSLGSLADEIPEARFDLWVAAQRAPLTVGILVMLTLVGAVQMISPGSGIAEAGLDKARYAAGENFRLFTGAFLHGNVIHFILNASALYYLGRRVEVLSRWPHLAIVSFASIVGGGWLTVAWLPDQTSVGVSGVVCGLLGFLLVFETLHRPLVPRPARRRLIVILASLGLIGLLGFKFVDNAAHLGGLMTGALYALVVFPKSASPHRPMILKQDLVLGGVGVILLVWSAISAIRAMLSYPP